MTKAWDGCALTQEDSSSPSIPGSLFGVLACPDCGGELSRIDSGGQPKGLACHHCELAHPIIDGIPVLLPRNLRNPKLELASVKGLLGETKSSGPLNRSVANTIQLLEEASSEQDSWEKDEEDYWSKVYEAESAAAMEKNWDNRIWQRQFLTDRLRREFDFGGKTILDCGCGEGQVLRFDLARVMDETTLYIGADISHRALLLNRARNKRANSAYVVCSAENLPFKPASTDVICYFGVLHHIQKKSGVLPDHVKLLRGGGYMLIHEPLTKAWNLPRFSDVGDGESPHEGTLERKVLIADIGSANSLRIVAARAYWSIFYGVALQYLRPHEKGQKGLFSVIVGVDTMLVSTLGRFVPMFRPIEILMLLKLGSERA